MPFQKFDRSEIKMMPLVSRLNKISVKDVRDPFNLLIGAFKDCELTDSVGRLIKRLASKIVKAYFKSKPVILMMGAHAIRRGNSKIFIKLIEQGIITHIATNGAAVIHDFELALIGATCENVEKYIKRGQFGNWQETGRYINEAIVRGYHDGIGLGEAIGRMIQDDEGGVVFPHKEVSVFAAAYRQGIPITVHKGIGYDITDQHPAADFAAIGATSGSDFLIFANSLSQIGDGGVLLNVGSQIMGPEIYLKALSMVRNVAAQKRQMIKKFTTANFDICDLGDQSKDNPRNEGTASDPHYYYRPLKTILVRSNKDGEQGIHIKGDFSQTIPALYVKIIDYLWGDDGVDKWMGTD